MKRAQLSYLAVPLLAALFSVGAVQAQTAADPAATSQGAAKLSKADQRMLEQLAQGNMAEIEAGKIALEKSQNADVKAFAQKMVDDHGKGLQEVQAVAQAKGVTLPSEPDAKQKAMAKQLNGLSGEAFDRGYLTQAGVSAHKAMHALVQRVQSKAKDADVKALGAKLEPTVAQHRTQVTQMHAGMRADTASGASGMGATGSGAGSAAGKRGAKADPTSGNTDHPANPQNPVPNPDKPRTQQQ